MTFLNKQEIEKLSVPKAKKLLKDTIKTYQVDGKTIDPEYFSILDSIVNQILHLEDHIAYQERYIEPHNEKTQPPQAQSISTIDKIT